MGKCCFLKIYFKLPKLIINFSFSNKTKVDINEQIKKEYKIFQKKYRKEDDKEYCKEDDKKDQE